ncbi:MAG: hypothetical protein sL5_02150 [Candidatus Mesenet longicola]|uniref:Uncharacterized protein n=1 Tax=Candidatus Mesenet longicola TaxID=1892558 RepID=A0A8J3MMI1_9RICK|nr:MAG: hypothetical protein sGL2_02140 [Candidatus Mesenet longicola]GHM59222.1 MAG: hypothetical protein sL5_02150 [Candidatus Mesenet longicola]
MRKIFCTIAVIILLFFTTYSGLWLYATSKTKNMLQKVSSYAKAYEIEFTYDDIATYGFPFGINLDIKNPEITIHQLTSIKLDSLLLKHKLFSKWLFLSIPNNIIDITISDNQENYSVVCNTHKLALTSKLNKLPFLLQIKDEFSVVDYVNLLRYEDHGLSCITLSSNSETSTKSSHGNHLQLIFDKKSDEHIKLSVSSHISEHTDIKDQISPEINANFDVEVLSNKSSIKLNLDIEKFSISGNSFTINAKGKLHDFIIAMLSYSFKGEISIDMSNYKESISFLASQYLPSSNTQAIDNIQELVLNVAQKISEDNIKVILSYNNDDKAVYIGNMQLDAFIDKIQKICNNEKEDIETNKYENTSN